MGQLIEMYVADAAGSPVRRVDEAEFIAGRGIVGDRYFTGLGTYSPVVQKPSHEVTLVELEQIEAFNVAYGTQLTAGDLRRNLVTRGIRLNDLVGADFSVGDVVLRGIKLCEPCEYVAATTVRQVLRGLTHRGGLRAGIITGGTTRIGVPVFVRSQRHQAR